MRRLPLVSALAAAFLLAGCKPPAFDQTIVCPAFEARGVAVYPWDANTYAVVFPDRTMVRIDRTECVIARTREIAPEKTPPDSRSNGDERTE